MPMIDILNQYTVEKSTDQNQSNLVNMYLEEEQTTKLSQYPYRAFPDPPKGEYKVISYSTFGLSLFGDTLQGQVRGLFEHNEVAYCVAGNKFGTLSSNGTFTQLATLNTTTGPVKMVCMTGGIDSNNQLVIIDGTNGYSYNIGTSTATFPITDANFPQTTISITEQDDFILAAVPNSMSFYQSNVSDSLTYPALNFASKFRKADKLVGVISYEGELWLCGSKTMEVWDNTGGTPVVFQRRSDVLIEVGLAANNSLVIAGNTLFGIVKAKTGGYAISQLSTSQGALTVSTKAVMLLLNRLTNISDAIGYAYAKDGHEFLEYVFPTDNKSITHDISNDTWFVRSSYVNSTYGRFLGNCHCFCYGKSLIGDFNSGKVYSQESTVYTENGVSLKRQFTSPPIYKEGKRLYIHRLQIDVQTNVGIGTFLLEVSTNRGNTWETVDTYTIPTSGDGTIYTTSMGSAFCFLFRITCTDDVFFSLLGFQADATVGAN